MLDTKFILNNLEEIAQVIRDKQADNPPHTDLERFVEADKQRRGTQAQRDQLMAQKRKLSKQIGPLMGKLKAVEDGAEQAALEKEVAALREQVGKVDDEIQDLAVAFAEADESLEEMRSWIPNVLPRGTRMGRGARVRFQTALPLRSRRRVGHRRHRTRGQGRRVGLVFPLRRRRAPGTRVDELVFR